MSRPQDQNRPDKLVKEFEAMSWKVACHFRPLLRSNQTLGFLELEDLQQEAMTHLLEHVEKFEGVTDRDERGIIAWYLCREGIWALYLRDSLESYSRDTNKNRAKKGLPPIVVPEVVPVISSAEMGLDDGDVTSLDFVMAPEPDHADFSDWLVTLEQTLPQREFAMLIDSTFNGLTWAEIGDKYGFTGKNPTTRGAQANDAVDAALIRAGYRARRERLRKRTSTRRKT